MTDRGEPDRDQFRLLAATAIALAAVPALAATTSGISPQRLSDIDKYHLVRRVRGPRPGDARRDQDDHYIADQFKAAGLQPGGDTVNGQRSWFQNVPLLKSDIVGTPQFALNLGNGQTSR